MPIDFLSQQMETVDLHFRWIDAVPPEVLSRSASKQLAKFLASLPCLTNLAISGDEYLHDDFLTELNSLAASSQVIPMSVLRQ